jgi:hypothetical protein
MSLVICLRTASLLTRVQNATVWTRTEFFHNEMYTHTQYAAIEYINKLHKYIQHMV